MAKTPTTPRGCFPYNGLPIPGWCPVGGVDVSWTSTIVQQFTEDYLMRNKSLSDVSRNNVQFCPDQIYHRDATVALDPTLTHGLLGYFYLPSRDITASSLTYAPPTNPDGYGWVQKKKLAQEFRMAPIMSDMVQYDAASGWNYFSSHISSKTNVPEGGNFLFEDGHVRWYNYPDIDTGASSSIWNCKYKIDLNWQ